jgi:hypothetical protein
MRRVLSLLFFLIIMTPVCAATEGGEGTSAVQSEIKAVRIFAGFTVSEGAQHQGLVAPTVVTLIESNGMLDCRFITFPLMPVALQASAPVPGKDDKVVFEGKSADPRGWSVSWTAELVGNEITGTFEQPHDKGKFFLEEAYLE